MMANLSFAQMMQTRAKHVHLGPNEWTALKHRIGHKVRSSLAALKAEITRLQSMPGQRGVFRDVPDKIDKEIIFWTLRPGEEVAPDLVDGPPMPRGTMPDIGPAGPPPGTPKGGRFPRNPRGRGNAPQPGAQSPPPSANPLPSAADRGSEIPAGADVVDRSLAQIQSSDLNERKQGVQRLGRTAADARLPQVVAALVPLLQSDDDFLVIDVIKTLGVWKSPDAVPALIERASDNRVFVRHEAFKVLAKTKDPRAVEPIIAHIKEDGFQVEDALKEMGAVAEPALIERLTNPDTAVRRRVCDILKAVGGKDALEAMQSLPADSDFSVRVRATEAMKAIVARVGPLSPIRARKGATDPPSRRKATP
jgi:HEAT repeats